MGKDKDKHEAHEQPEARERRLRKRFAKKWRGPSDEAKFLARHSQEAIAKSMKRCE